MKKQTKTCLKQQTYQAALIYSIFFRLFHQKIYILNFIIFAFHSRFQ